jgi:hypothetical protein
MHKSTLELRLGRFTYLLLENSTVQTADQVHLRTYRRDAAAGIPRSIDLAITVRLQPLAKTHETTRLAYNRNRSA